MICGRYTVHSLYSTCSKWDTLYLPIYKLGWDQGTDCELTWLGLFAVLNDQMLSNEFWLAESLLTQCSCTPLHSSYCLIIINKCLRATSVGSHSWPGQNRATVAPCLIHALVLWAMSSSFSSPHFLLSIVLIDFNFQPVHITLFHNSTCLYVFVICVFENY